MKKLIYATIIILMSPVVTIAQESEKETNPLNISGSIDIYYKYDFAGQSNIPTSFAGDHNSFSIGMLDLKASKEIGKASFFAEIGLGPRNAASVGPSINESQPGIQNLYISYQLSNNLSVTAGYMGTFVGYEVISPTGNFNYSTSYMFTNGPFQNAGVKFNYTISEKVSVMGGVFNDWNVYQQSEGNGINSYGGQLSLTPVDDWDVYVNFISGKNDGAEIDLTTGFQVSETFYLGLNAARWKYKIPESTDVADFMGVALYTQATLSDYVSLGLRSEWFSSQNTGYIGMNPSSVEAESVTAFTLSANIGTGYFKFIPEIRYDAASEDVFTNADGNPANSAIQVLGALVFSF